MLPAVTGESQRAQSRKGAGGANLPQPVSGERPLHLVLASKVEGLPKDLGFTLIAIGAAGVVIPGTLPPGISFILLGTALVWPCLLVRFGGGVARRFPWMAWVLIGFVDHLRADLEKRYPGSVRPDEKA